jgi:FMN phosphatase YigB (HAD superfamily)
MAHAPFDHLIFDLDDTLLDTSRQLLPRASRDACAAMIAAGLESGLEECVKAWDEHQITQDRHEIFTFLVERFGIREGIDAASVVNRGFHAFYNRRVESTITLFPQMREILVALHKTYGIHLVTAGNRATQEEKIRILKIHDLFDGIHHVDPSRGEFKRDAFHKIMTKTACPPKRYLSVGNRIDSDIAEAKLLGWKTCWVRYGEHASILPTTPLEQPDFVIAMTSELVEKCHL